MEISSESTGNTGITDAQIRDAIGLVNIQGYAVLDLPAQLKFSLGSSLYSAMDAETFHPHRHRYYNEIAFYWPRFTRL